MKLFCLILLLALANPSASVAADDTTPLARIRPAMQRFVDQGEIAGAVTVVAGSIQSNHTLAQERGMFSFSTRRASKFSRRPRAHTLFPLRGKMSNSLRNAFILCALVLCAVSAFGQTEREIEDKYGKPVKIYSVDDTIWMSVEYTSDGQACQMTLFPKRVSTDTVYLYGQLPLYELKRVLNDIAPQSERGDRGD